MRSPVLQVNTAPCANSAAPARTEEPAITSPGSAAACPAGWYGAARRRLAANHQKHSHCTKQRKSEQHETVWNTFSVTVQLKHHPFCRSGLRLPAAFYLPDCKMQQQRRRRSSVLQQEVPELNQHGRWNGWRRTPLLSRNKMADSRS